MPALDFDAFLRSLKRGEILPAYYFHGDQDLLKDDALRDLLAVALDPSTRDFNLDRRRAPELTAQDFTTLALAPPMLTPRPAVVIGEGEGRPPGPGGGGGRRSRSGGRAPRRDGVRLRGCGHGAPPCRVRRDDSVPAERSRQHGRASRLVARDGAHRRGAGARALGRRRVGGCGAGGAVQGDAGSAGGGGARLGHGGRGGGA